MAKSNAAALARYVSQLTGGGRECVDVLVSIMRDEHGATVAERTAAAKELMDRGFGKSAQVVEHEVTIIGAQLDPSKLSTARIAELRAGLAELAAASGVAAPQLPARSGVIDVTSAEVEDGDALEWDEEPTPESDE